MDLNDRGKDVEHKGDGSVSQATKLLGEDISLEVELKCQQDQNKGAAAK
jgi:hypothetical protein